MLRKIVHCLVAEWPIKFGAPGRKGGRMMLNELEQIVEAVDEVSYADRVFFELARKKQCGGGYVLSIHGSRTG